MKPNNPRVFAETVSIDAWRTEYDGEKAEADLHIDVVFGQGRIGGDDVDESPVRFRLSLKRAEVHVKRDLAGTIKIPSSSISRTPMKKGKSEYKEELSGDVNASVAVSADQKSASAKVDAKASAAAQVTKKYEESGEVSPMKISHGRTENGYVFRIEPMRGDRLDGQPWPAEERKMKLIDTKAGRERGDPPEVTIDIRCKREDLIIEGIEFKEGSLFDFAKLTRTKQVAVEQYIKLQIEKIGLECGDISEPFATLILGDVSPHAE